MKDDVSKRDRQDWEKSHVLGCGNRVEEDALWIQDTQKENQDRRLPRMTAGGSADFRNQINQSQQ